MVELAISRRTRATPFTSRVMDKGVRAVAVYNNTILPVVINSLEADYHHLKQHVQLWDVGGERQVEIRGMDAAWLTQYLTPRDLSRAQIGQCLYAPLVDEDGGMVNDPIILKLAEDHFWLSIASSDALLWVKGLAAGLRCNVTVSEPPVTPLAIQGPKSDDLMMRVFDASVTDLRFFRFDYFEVDRYRYMVAKSGWSKQGGYEVYVDDPEAGQFLYDALWQAGEDLNVGSGCPNLIERIEGGLLSYGNDMTLADTPFECGLEQYCNWKEDTEFLARPALESFASCGAPKRRMTGIQLIGDHCPHCMETWPVSAAGDPIGTLTSAAYSPDFGCIVALGMLKTPYDTPGQNISVQTPEGILEGVTVSLPMKKVLCHD